jgi:drug/metabolite transporter (DMT)-like permease
MNKLLMLAALAEAGTGVILLAYPPIVVRLLFDAEIAGTGVIMSRLAGIALIGLGAACWPGNSAFHPLYGVLTYSTMAMLYLIVIGVRGGGVGLLLWPGVVRPCHTDRSSGRRAIEKTKESGHIVLSVQQA